MAKNPAKGLTVLQKRFCDILHSMKEPNQARALQLAGSKCNKKALESTASRMLSIAKVKRYFAKLQKRSTDRAVKSKDDIVKRLESLAWPDLYELVKIDRFGNMTYKKLSDLSKAQRLLISQISEKDTAYGKHRSFKTPDPLKALELLMRHKKMFGDIDDAAETFAEALHKAMTEGK